MACWRALADAILVDVRLTPKSAHDLIEGIGFLSDRREVVVVRVRAIPEDGAANKALALLFARAFDVPKSSVSIVAGGKTRLKQVRVEGKPAAFSKVIQKWPRSA